MESGLLPQRLGPAQVALCQVPFAGVVSVYRALAPRTDGLGGDESFCSRWLRRQEH